VDILIPEDETDAMMTGRALRQTGAIRVGITSDSNGCAEASGIGEMSDVREVYRLGGNLIPGNRG